MGLDWVWIGFGLGLGLGFRACSVVLRLTLILGTPVIKAQFHTQKATRAVCFIDLQLTLFVKNLNRK